MYLLCVDRYTTGTCIFIRFLFKLDARICKILILPKIEYVLAYCASNNNAYVFSYYVVSTVQFVRSFVRLSSLTSPLNNIARVHGRIFPNVLTVSNNMSGRISLELFVNTGTQQAGGGRTCQLTVGNGRPFGPKHIRRGARNVIERSTLFTKYPTMYSDNTLSKTSSSRLNQLHRRSPKLTLNLRRTGQCRA